MIGLPWFLLAAGIGIVILGAFMAGLSRPPGKGGPAIHRRLRDDEIARRLNRAERLPAWGVVILIGFACILVSVIWRLARVIL